MEKLQGTSMDIVQDNIEKLKQIFPEVFAEGKIDFQVLKQLLGEYLEMIRKDTLLLGKERHKQDR